jgi:hypothetical protein
MSLNIGNLDAESVWREHKGSSRNRMSHHRLRLGYPIEVKGSPPIVIPQEGLFCLVFIVDHGEAICWCNHCIRVGYVALLFVLNVCFTNVDPTRTLARNRRGHRVTD